jgi:hypothetical protein
VEPGLKLHVQEGWSPSDLPRLEERLRGILAALFRNGEKQ